MFEKLVNIQKERAQNHRVIQQVLFGFIHGDIDLLDENLDDRGCFMASGKTQFLARYGSWFNRLRKENPLIQMTKGLDLNGIPGEVAYEMRYRVGLTLEELNAESVAQFGSPLSDDEGVFRFSMRIENLRVVEIVEPGTYCSYSDLFPDNLQFGKN